MNIINTKEIAQEIKDAFKASMTKGIAPKLVILQVEGDKASDSYVKNKIKYYNMKKNNNINFNHVI